MNNVNVGYTKPEDIKEYDCSMCEHIETCEHKNAYRRFPRKFGGLGLCKNIPESKLYKEIEYE